MKFHVIAFASATVTASLVAIASAQVDYAVIGDFGVGTVGTPPAPSAAPLAVSNFVKNVLQPQFIVTVGDNNYLNNGSTAGWDAAVWQYYSPYIKYPAGSTSQYAGNGVTTNRYFPALGNHDLDAGNFAAYHELPGNEEYYDFVQGPVHTFVINSDPRSAFDGNAGGAPGNSLVAQRSTQGQWLKNGLAASTSPFKVVVFHHPTYSSSSVHGSTGYMELPFRAWGANLVLNGHDHTYERVMEPGTGVPFVVVGNSGQSLYSFGTPVAGSAIRYNGDYGAARITASSTSLVLSSYDKDTVTLDNPAGPIVNAVDRVQIAPYAQQAYVTEFQQGWNGYASAQDTFVQSNAPSTASGGATVLNADQDASPGVTQALVRFDNLFGNGAGQVPAGATILQARLILATGSASNAGSANAINAYRMTLDWTDAATWNSLGNGVDVGTDTLASPDDAQLFSTANLGESFDVTAALKAWQFDPSLNKGWALINTGTDGWQFNASEGGTLDLRPALQVTYTVPEPAALVCVPCAAFVLRRRR